MTHYRVELDIYVRDEKALCTHAWGAALREFGPGLAELVTMSRGQYDAIKCLAVIYQLTDHGDEVVSAGIYVTEDTK
ncbi:MAG TPA: hypothetical protein VD932_03860 [Aquabacterium sp.]|nr:hypothetical protein [Aquabacterium sp.]